MSGRRRRQALVVAVVATLSATAAPAGSHFKNPGATKCRPMALGGGAKASQIRKKGISCQNARLMTQAVNNQARHPFGFNCKIRIHHGRRFRAHSDYRCKKGASVVTWIEK
jgi:hypothetical protein